MSDHYIKIIPTDPFLHISNEAKSKIEDHIKSIVKADSIEVNLYDTPSFIDCGGELEKINCPVCGNEISFDWWGEAMDKASENEFQDLEIKTPCCDSLTSLNELKYHFPCAFACSELVIMNPENNISESVICDIENMLKYPVRIIKAHI